MIRRILYVQTTAEIGGADVCLLRLVSALDGGQFRALVVAPKEGPLTKAMHDAGAKVIIEPSMMRLSSQMGWRYSLRYVLHYPRAVWRLARIIRRERIGIVHSNTLHALHGFAAAWLTRRPHVWHVREIVMQSRWIRRAEVMLARRFSKRIVTMSAAIAAMFGRKAPVTVVRDGIDLRRFHPHNDGTEIRKALNIAADDVVAGVVCRLDHWKGVEVFLRAAALCLARVPNAKFIVAGGAIEGRDDIPAALHALAGELGIRDAVRFTDWDYGPEEMPALHAALDVLVLASTWPEPFGLVLIEAMATGRPVIATRHGGPMEIVADGVTGLLVRPCDVHALAEAMVALMTGRERRERMGRAARACVEREFDEARSIAAVHRIYDEVLKR